MPDRPYTLLSCGMSIDGYLDGGSPRRLALSNEADFDRVAFHLAGSLADAGVAPEIITEITAAVLPLAGDIVSRGL